MKTIDNAINSLKSKSLIAENGIVEPGDLVMTTDEFFLHAFADSVVINSFSIRKREKLMYLGAKIVRKHEVFFFLHDGKAIGAFDTRNSNDWSCCLKIVK